MTPRTGKALQEAKKAAAARFEVIAEAMMKEAGVKSWEFHSRGLAGTAWPKEKRITVPKPTTRRRLYIVAHECAHIALVHVKRLPSHRQEYEAEIYAHEAMRRHGVPVPKKETENAKHYVARRIDQAIRMGKAKRLDREAVRWCEAFHREATKKALAKDTIELLDLSSKPRKGRGGRRMNSVPATSAGSIGETVRKAFRKSGLSVRELSSLAAVDQSALNRFMNGTRNNIQTDVLEKLMPHIGLRLVVESS